MQLNKKFFKKFKKGKIKVVCESVREAKEFKGWLHNLGITWSKGKGGLKNLTVEHNDTCSPFPGNVYYRHSRSLCGIVYGIAYRGMKQKVKYSDLVLKEDKVLLKSVEERKDDSTVKAVFDELDLMSETKVTVVKTVGREVLDKVLKYVWQVESKANFKKFYKSEHSPIYTQRFMIYCVATKGVFDQLRTHEKNGCQFFSDSARPDTGKNKGATGRNSLRYFVIDCNAKNIIDMARKRLCMKAEAPTRKFMQKIVEAVRVADPELAECCEPKCEYMGGRCNEFKPCGKYPVM